MVYEAENVRRSIKEDEESCGQKSSSFNINHQLADTQNPILIHIGMEIQTLATLPNCVC